MSSLFLVALNWSLSHLISCPPLLLKRMRDMDKDYTDDEIQEVMDVVDLTGSGDISFEEFCKVFIANIKTSASI